MFPSTNIEVPRCRTGFPSSNQAPRPRILFLSKTLSNPPQITSLSAISGAILKLSVLFKETSELSLEEHLCQLKSLYGELPQKIKVLVRTSKVSNNLFSVLGKFAVALSEYSNEYEEIDNPNYPEESYEAFILRMIKMKKLKIEKVLDLK